MPAAAEGIEPEDGDVFVFTQKVVSKSEGRIVSLASVEPCALASRFGEESARDPGSWSGAPGSAAGSSHGPAACS